MNTVRLIAIAMTLATLNPGLVLANPELDSNVQVAHVSNDTNPAADGEECGAHCSTEKRSSELEKEVRRDYPVRERLRDR